MTFNMEIIDLVLVISLAFLALSSVIFIIFFVPVLIQLARTLEALHTLITLLKDYVVAVNNKINSAGQTLSQAGAFLFNLGSSLGEGFIDLVGNFFKRK